MNFCVYDEDCKMIRSFQRKSEAVAFLQDGWSIKRIAKRNRYIEAFNILKEALI